MLYTDSAALIGYATAPKELRRRVHQPVPQSKYLKQVITVFSHALVAFRFRMANLWRLTRRKHGQKDQTTWDWVTKIIDEGPFVL